MDHRREVHVLLASRGVRLTPERVGLPTHGDKRRVPGSFFCLDVNGKRMQTGNRRTMIFGVAETVSYHSRFMTLLPGDIVTKGTSPGVGMGIKPEPIFLKPGDVMILGIEGLGEQRQEVIAWQRTWGGPSNGL